MRIAIIGTRGIPNYHGGFEQFAEYFSVFLVEQGHEVYVYNSSSHPHKESKYKDVNIISCKDPEDKIGTAGQFIYDFNCIIDSRKRKFDILLQLGYTSSSIWYKLLPSKPVIITNMDGLEWMRSKYSRFVQKFLRFAEKLGVHSSDFLISDSIGIQNYLKEKYKVNSKYIAYGASLFEHADIKVLNDYELEKFKYNLLIARFEPENNLETILDGVVLSGKKDVFLVIGKHNTNSFGVYLKDKYKNDKHIRFIGGIYDIRILNNLRYYSNLYFHGHSVGGTNPSLLEAMASKTLIIANDNQFNKSILESDAFYFKDKKDVKKIILSVNKNDYYNKVERCFSKIRTKYNWDLINQAYLDYFYLCINQDKEKGLKTSPAQNI